MGRFCQERKILFLDGFELHADVFENEVGGRTVRRCHGHVDMEDVVVVDVDVHGPQDGRAAFERADDDITVFDMTGLALQDLTVARMLQRRAAATGTGTRIAWPW